MSSNTMVKQAQDKGMDKATLGAILGVAMGAGAGYGASRYLLGQKSRMANAAMAAGGGLLGGGAGLALGGAYGQGEKENAAADKVERTAEDEKLSAERKSREINSTVDTKPPAGIKGQIASTALDTASKFTAPFVAPGVTLGVLKSIYGLGDLAVSNKKNVETAKTIPNPAGSGKIPNPRLGELKASGPVTRSAADIIYPKAKGISLSTVSKGVKNLTQSKWGYLITMLAGIANAAPGTIDYYKHPINNTLDIVKPKFLQK